LIFGFTLGENSENFSGEKVERSREQAFVLLATSQSKSILFLVPRWSLTCTDGASSCSKSLLL